METRSLRAERYRARTCDRESHHRINFQQERDMYALRSLRSKHAAPLTLAAAGLWASSRIYRRAPTVAAEPATPARQPSQPHTARSNADGEKGEPAATAAAGDSKSEEEKKSIFPPPVGPMIAVFLDKPSVDKLKAHFPEARDGQLRKVVLQYGPSASEREMYRHLFSGEAEVTITGDASSFGRRALVASVSHAGKIVEPKSLSAAIDISPLPEEPPVDNKDGPGPLASAALIEQVKQAGGAEEEMWEGTLPPLLAHRRQFPSESGAYVKLKEPITVRGTICRADWVDGTSNVCRDTLEGGEKRTEDWQPSDCSICAFFSVSPCNRIFDRFIEASKRRDEYLKTFEPEEEQGDDGDREGDEGGVSRESEATRKKIQEKTGGDSNGPDDARATPVAREEKKEGSRHTGPAPAEEGREGVTPVGKEDGGGSAVGNAAEESRRRQAERDLIEEQLEKEALALFHELRECTTYHDL